MYRNRKKYIKPAGWILFLLCFYAAASFTGCGVFLLSPFGVPPALPQRLVSVPLAFEYGSEITPSRISRCF